MNKLFQSDIWQGLVSLSPFALVLLLLSFWEPLLTTVPDHSDLSVISGTADIIGKKSGSVKTSEGNIKIKYECLCNYGWGEKSFEQGLPVHGRGTEDNGTYKLWELKIGDTEVFSYQDTAADILDDVEDARTVAIPSIIISSILTLVFGLGKIKDRKNQAHRDVLFALLDDLADTSKADPERIATLEKIVAYDASDIVDTLEGISMNNTNSDDLLSRIGSELGTLWSAMDIEEIEAVTYIQPAAKTSAVKILKSTNTELYTKLEEIGAVST